MKNKTLLPAQTQPPEDINAGQSVTSDRAHDGRAATDRTSAQLQNAHSALPAETPEMRLPDDSIRQP